MLSEEYLIIIDALKSGNIHKITRSIDQLVDENYSDLFTSAKYKDYKEIMDNHYYRALSRFLATMQFKKFRKLFSYSDKLGIFIDVKKIPNRFEIICNLHLDGIRIGQTGRIFDIIRFFNDYNLFEKDFTDKELEILEDLKKDTLLLANLKDLFGKVSNSLIFYSCKIIPYDLYLMFSNNLNPVMIQENFFFLKNVFDRYPIYGFAVENLGSTEKFFEKFMEAYKHELRKLNIEERKDYNNDLKLIEFYFPNYKKHLVSPQVLLKIRDQVLDKSNYNFFNLSMVLFGGLGPQGYGFTYSTSKGEVIEICSDIKEHDAIIVKYKQFLKQQFLKKLETTLDNSPIDENITNKIITYLNEALNPDEVINYFNKDAILKQIIELFNESQNFSVHENEYFQIISSISDSITRILRNIKLEDQFKTRIGLIDDDKVKSEELAKLTNLKGKSHYDILRERFFFQNEIKWFYKDYTSKLIKFRDRL